MSSSVFTRFKSQKEPSRITFDGTGISVFELKREIISINGLGDGHDFDLAIFNEDSNEVYDDDTTIIPRSTSVLAKRLPPARPGRGSAARYVTGKMPVSAKNSSRTEKSATRDAVPKNSASTPANPVAANSAISEEDRIAAMLNADAEQWDQQKKEMANATPVYRSNPKGKPQANVPSNPPPVGYVCYRCGEKGHWIQQCPTNDNPNFDGRPRVKRTTGIPRSFLRTVAKPESLSKDGAADGTSIPSGVMVNADGEFVVAEPDSASWAQFQAKAQASEQAQQLATQGTKELQDLGLECSIDKRMFVDPTKTPCCSKTYCNDCITNALLEGDLTCPNCQTEGVILDELAPDEEMVSKIKSFVQKKEQKNESSGTTVTASKETTGVSSSGAITAAKPSAAGKLTASNLNGSTTGDSPNRALTLTPDARSTTSTGSKKRAADDELNNDHIPKAPAAMRQQQAQMNQNGMMLNMPNGFNAQNLPNGGFMGDGMGYPNGMMGMPGSMGPMMPMAGTGMMNPMMAMNGYGGFNGMNGMGFPQANGMYGQGFNGGGFDPMMAMQQQQMQANMMMQMQQQQNQQNGPQMNMGSSMAFPNQQRSGTTGTGNEEDSPYFRQPVNPGRYQDRRKRPRPTSWREL